MGLRLLIVRVSTDRTRAAYGARSVTAAARLRVVMADEARNEGRLVPGEPGKGGDARRHITGQALQGRILSADHYLSTKESRVMKKIVFAALLILAAATTARAEHKLLITDVLEDKEIEAQATFEYSRVQSSFAGPVNGRTIGNSTDSRYSLGVGLGHGLEVTASIPYVLSERSKVEFNNPAIEPEYEKKDGFGDFSFGGKYCLLDEKKGPVSLVAGLDIKFDTAGGRNNPGTQTTDVSPYLAASKKLGHHFTPYAAYRATISNHGQADSHVLTLGSENELNETVTIDTRFDATFATATDDLSALETYSLEVASYLQLFHNFYLIPSVAVATGSTAHSKVADVHFGSPFGVRGGLSLYYLY